MGTENLKTNNPVSQRVRLVKIFIVLFLIAIIVVWNVFSGYSDSSSVKKDKYLIHYNLNELKAGEVRILHPHGLPVVIMHRTDATLKQLLAIRSVLSDPDSNKSYQPSFAKNYYRSLKPEYFIAYAVTPRLGIEVRYRLDSFDVSPHLKDFWFGGFAESSHTGFLFDKAGRSYLQQSVNLDIPNYKITPDNQLYVYTLKEIDFD